MVFTYKCVSMELPIDFQQVYTAPPTSTDLSYRQRVKNRDMKSDPEGATSITTNSELERYTEKLCNIRMEIMQECCGVDLQVYTAGMRL